jgi:hypothetical protein
MQRSLIALAAAFLFLASADARLGETEAQIQAHYGSPLALLPTRAGEPGVSKCYSAEGFIVSVTYINGNSVREIFAKPDSSKISEGEIHAALKTNARDSAWKPEELVSSNAAIVGVQKWRTNDQSTRVAFYDSQTRALFITTQRFIDLSNASKRQSLARSSSTTLGGPGARPVGPSLRNNFNVMDKGSILRSSRSQPHPSATPR